MKKNQNQKNSKLNAFYGYKRTFFDVFDLTPDLIKKNSSKNIENIERSQKRIIITATRHMYKQKEIRTNIFTCDKKKVKHSEDQITIFLHFLKKFFLVKDGQNLQRFLYSFFVCLIDHN